MPLGHQQRTLEKNRKKMKKSANAVKSSKKRSAKSARRNGKKKRNDENGTRAAVTTNIADDIPRTLLRNLRTMIGAAVAKGLPARVETGIEDGTTRRIVVIGKDLGAVTEVAIGGPEMVMERENHGGGRGAGRGHLLVIAGTVLRLRIDVELGTTDDARILATDTAETGVEIKNQIHGILNCN